MVMINIPIFLLSIIILFAFIFIFGINQWNTFQGKIFTIHLIIKFLWFFAIFLTALEIYEFVYIGALIYPVLVFGLGYTMYLFAISFVFKRKKFNKIAKISGIIILVYLISLYALHFLNISPYFNLSEDSLNSFYFNILSYYLIIPALFITSSYYLTAAFFLKLSKDKKGLKISRDYFFLGFGLLIHIIIGQLLTILELFFGFKYLIINMEYAALIGMSIALYGYYNIAKFK